MRESALKWWRSIEASEQLDVVNSWKLITEDFRKNWSFMEISSSSSTIEKVWREFINNENF